MPEVISKVLSSRKDMAALVLLVALCVFFAMGRVTLEQWWEMAKWVAGPWLLARGIEDAVTSIKNPADSVVTNVVTTAKTPLGDAQEQVVTTTKLPDP